MARRPRGTKAHRPEDVEIDKHIGQRVRERRKVLGLRQTALAARLGISVHQLHNYETGSNRIGVGRLYGCAQLLYVRPECFFEGLEGSDSGTPDETQSDEAMKLVRAYYRISDPTQRHHVRKLVQALARSTS